MNGKPGDHPITDIVRHRIARYGDPLDEQIRQLGGLMSYHRLCDWFEQHWSKSPELDRASAPIKLGAGSLK